MISPNAPEGLSMIQGLAIMLILVLTCIIIRLQSSKSILIAKTAILEKALKDQMTTHGLEMKTQQNNIKYLKEDLQIALRSYHALYTRKLYISLEKAGRRPGDYLKTTTESRGLYRYWRVTVRDKRFKSNVIDICLNSVEVRYPYEHYTELQQVVWSAYDGRKGCFKFDDFDEAIGFFECIVKDYGSSAPDPKPVKVA